MGAFPVGSNEAVVVVFLVGIKTELPVLIEALEAPDASEFRLGL